MVVPSRDLGEGGGKPRLVYVDGKHDPGMWDTYMGESVGRWEGDTFIVDTVKIAIYARLSSDGIPHSAALHMTERFRLRDRNTLEVQITFADPKMLAKPWVVTATYERRDNLRPIENDCDPKERTRP